MRGIMYRWMVGGVVLGMVLLGGCGNVPTSTERLTDDTNSTNTITEDTDQWPISDENMMDADDWKSVYGVDIVGPVPELPSNIRDILNSQDTISQRQVKDVYYLMLIPKRIKKGNDEIELTIKTYSDPTDGLIHDVKMGYYASKINDRYIKNGGYSEQWSQVSVDQTKWVLFYIGTDEDDGLLKDSRSKSWDTQVDYVDGLNQEMKNAVDNGRLFTSTSEDMTTLLHIASPLELVIATMSRYNKTGEGLLNFLDQTKKSYARTENVWTAWENATGFRVTVGFFDSLTGTLNIDDDDDDDLENQAYGVGVFRAI